MTRDAPHRARSPSTSSTGLSRRQFLATSTGGIASAAGCLGILGSDDSSVDAGPWSQKRSGPRNRSFGPQSGPGEDVETSFTWTHPETENVPTGWGQLLYSATSTDGDRLYCSVNGSLVPRDGDTIGVNDVLAIDPESRTVVWTADTAGYAGAGVVSPPAVADGVVVHCGNQPIALDAADGTELWTRDVSTNYYPPTIADETVYLPTAAGLHAVALEDGEDVWTSDAGADDPVPRTRPAVGDAVYASVQNEVVSYDRDTGEERWRTRHDAFESIRTVPGEPGLLGAPVLGSDAVFVAGGRRQLDHHDHGGLVAFGLEDGGELWQFDFEAAFDRSIPREPVLEHGHPTGEREPTGVYGTPALAGDTLYAAGYLAGTPKLIAVDATTGKLRWDADLEDVANHVLVGGDVVYVPRAGGVESYDRADGTDLGTSTVDDLQFPRNLGAGSLTEDRLLVPSSSGLFGFGG